MPALDFKEIGLPQTASCADQFELFAREFLEYKGFKVIEGPDRGADGGRDSIVTERRIGPGGETTVRWLVSCKHKAHGGASVSPSDEPNIRDRLETRECDGFIGFYSTIVSTGLFQILSSFPQDMNTSSMIRSLLSANCLLNLADTL